MFIIAPVGQDKLHAMQYDKPHTDGNVRPVDTFLAWFSLDRGHGGLRRVCGNQGYREPAGNLYSRAGTVAIGDIEA